MSNPTVSVIIANYNRADLLEEAIQSVMDQTFQDFELLVVDDGSQDHSLAVIETFRKRSPEKCRLFMHEGHANRGIVPTYSLAISKARGEFVAFLEHDDRWSPGYLAGKVSVFESYPEVGVVFSPYRVVGNGWFGQDMALRRWLLRPTIKSGRPFDNFPNLLQSNNVATFSCFATRKLLLDAIPTPSGKTLALDWWILNHLSIQSFFYYDNSSLTFWRWSKQSVMGRQTFDEHRDHGCSYMELMYQQFSENMAQMPEDKREIFQSHRETFSYFLSFYRKPEMGNFFRFFVRSPMWALASGVSLIINRFKFN